MGLPVFQSGWKIKQQEEGLSIVVDKPDGVIEGNLLIAFICSDGSETFTPASGFTAVAAALVSGGGGNECTTQVWWKEAGASEPATYTWGIASSEEAVLSMVRITGHFVDDPIGKFTTDIGASVTPTCPDLTTAQDDALVLRFYGADDDDQDTDAGYPTGHTGVFNRGSSTTAGSCSAGLAHENQATKGSPGTAAFTNLGSEDWGAWTIAIYSERKGNAVSSDLDANKHYLHDGFSSVVTDSYTSPSTFPEGVTWDGANLLSADANTDKHYKHSGFSSTIDDSYAPAGWLYPTDITWDGENVISAEEFTVDKHRLHSGFSSTIDDSYGSPASIPKGITWDGSNVISANEQTPDKHYLHAGFSQTIDDSYLVAKNFAHGVTWHGVDGVLISVQQVIGDKHLRHAEGFTATIDDSYDSPSTNPRGITWDGRYEHVGMGLIKSAGVVPLRNPPI